MEPTQEAGFNSEINEYEYSNEYEYNIERELSEKPIDDDEHATEAVPTPAPEQGKRFNEGKLRYDLCPAFAQQQYAEVLTKGAKKYGDNNWRKGMPWMSVIASLERHLMAFKQGENYDRESGNLHTAHIMCNAAFLTEYVKLHPHYDDRPVSYLNSLSIGIVASDVLFDSKYDTKEKNWLETPMKASPDEINFEVSCFINKTNLYWMSLAKWLIQNGYKHAPIYDAIHEDTDNLIKVIKGKQLDIVIVGTVDEYIELSRAGIYCYLYDLDFVPNGNCVKYRRIKSLNDIIP